MLEVQYRSQYLIFFGQLAEMNAKCNIKSVTAVLVNNTKFGNLGFAEAEKKVFKLRLWRFIQDTDLIYYVLSVIRHIWATYRNKPVPVVVPETNSTRIA